MIFVSQMTPHLERPLYVRQVPRRLSVCIYLNAEDMFTRYRTAFNLAPSNPNYTPTVRKLVSCLGIRCCCFNMSNITLSRQDTNRNSESPLFCTPPPEEMQALAKGAIGVDTNADIEHHVSEMRSPQPVKEEMSPTVRAKERFNEVLYSHELWNTTSSEKELSDCQFQSTSRVYMPQGDHIAMATLGRSLTTSVDRLKSGSSSTRTHFPSGKLEESRSLASKSKALEQTSNIQDISGISYSHRSEQPRALLTGYSSSEKEDSQHLSYSQDQRGKRQQPQLKYKPRERVSAAKFESAEVVKSDSDRDEDPRRGHARLSQGKSDTDRRSAKQHPSAITLHDKTPYPKALRDSKGAHDDSLSTPKQIRRRVADSSKHGKLTVTMNRPGRTATKRRVLSPTSKAHVKRPKLRGGFVDNESDSDSDLDSDGSEGNGMSKNGDEEPEADREITVNWKSKPVNPPPKQLSVEVHRAVPSPTPQPSRRVNVGRIKALLRKKDEATLAKLATPSNTPRDRAIAAVVHDSSSKQAQPELHVARGSSIVTSHVPKSLTSSAQQSVSKTQTAGSTARSVMQGNSIRVNKELSRSTDVKPALNTSITVNPVQSASRSARNGGSSAVTPGLALSLNKKPACSEGRLVVASDTVPTRHGTQDAGSAIAPRIGTAMAGRTKLVGNFQGTRQSGQPQNAAILHKSPSTSAQVKEHGHVSQMPDGPRIGTTNPRNQVLQQTQSKKTSEAPRKQITLPHQSLAAPIKGVTKTVSPTKRLGATQNPSPQTAPRPHTPQNKIMRTTTPNLQLPNSVTSVQKRKAEDMVRESSGDAPLAKKLATALTNSNNVTRSSTEALDKPNTTKSSSSNKSTAASAPTASQKEAAVSRSTPATKQKPQTPTPTTTVQKTNPTPLTTIEKQPNLQNQAPRNVPKELIQNSNLAQVKGSSANLPHSAQSDTITTQKLYVCVENPVRYLSTVVQGPKDTNSNGTKVAQVKDDVPQQVSAEIQKGQGEPAREAERLVSSPIATSPPSIPVGLPKTNPKLPEKLPPPASQLTKEGPDPARDSPTSTVKIQQPHDTAPQQKSTPVTILSTSPTLAPDAEPYFEYSIFQKIWLESEDESSATARELTSLPCTNIDEANDQAEKLFNDALHQYKQHFRVQFIEWTNRLDEHGCNALTGTFAPNEYPTKKSRMKLWVQRDQVSVYAGRGEKDLKCTSFIAKTLYVVRLFKLVPATTDSDTDDTTEPAKSTRVYHPLPCTECYTTLEAANRAAKNLQIELSHKTNPNNLDKLWQIQNLAQLNRRMRDLAEAETEEEKYWKSEFNGSGLGSATFELMVERVGLCGPRNL
jgi:hypothetical protein